jgi:hypothetical protein
MKPFAWILRYPVAYVTTTLVGLLIVWAVISFFVTPAESLTVLNALVPLWGLVAVLFGLVPTIAQWHQSAAQWRASLVEKLKDGKPLVLTERLPNGELEVRNVGGGVAVNVWLLTQRNGQASCLGCLVPGESRALPAPVPTRHLIVAEARPFSGRRFTPTMNVLTESGVCHGFTVLADPSRECSIQQFLGMEQQALGQLWGWLPGEQDANTGASLV